MEVWAVSLNHFMPTPLLLATTMVDQGLPSMTTLIENSEFGPHSLLSKQVENIHQVNPVVVFVLSLQMVKSQKHEVSKITPKAFTFTHPQSLGTGSHCIE
ncbi:hypothetical protein VNO80_05745 [Phaseolus coccineus]|uniref:Uncharacterized protein n=1 Tax=Phaseolus coccineus TaxID=3886 RepID=A0AAN9NKG0_PHACN